MVKANCDSKINNLRWFKDEDEYIKNAILFNPNIIPTI